MAEHGHSVRHGPGTKLRPVFALYVKNVFNNNYTVEEGILDNIICFPDSFGRKGAFMAGLWLNIAPVFAMALVQSYALLLLFMSKLCL